MRESNNKRNHAHAQAMVISSAAGELTLGIGLGFVSVGLGILGLIIKSDCEELSCCYGLIWCKKKRRRTRRGSGDSGTSDSSGDPPAGVETDGDAGGASAARISEQNWPPGSVWREVRRLVLVFVR